MDIILNQVAIWTRCGAKNLNVRKSPVGEKYREPNGVVYQIAQKPLLRYAKDYKIGKIEYCLFVRTQCEDEKKVESALDAYAKKITKEYALSAIATATSMHFEYTPYTLEVK